MTVCIIGAGELGGAIGHALARGERVRRVFLIDEAGTMAAGKALDIQQAGAVDGSHTRVEGTTDLTRVTGCAVCVVADSARPAGEWQGENALAMMRRLAGFVGEAPIVFAGAAQSGLLLASVRGGGCARQRVGGSAPAGLGCGSRAVGAGGARRAALRASVGEAGLARQRVVGSAPGALASATRAIVALEARCSSAEVSLNVLGTPPAGFVVPWGEASIAGYALERVLTQVQIRRVEARMARLWPLGPHALGLAAARVVEALVTTTRRAPSVLAVLGGDFGVRDRVGVLPCLLPPGGIAQTRIPDLSARARVQLDTALGG